MQDDGKFSGNGNLGFAQAASLRQPNTSDMDHLDRRHCERSTIRQPARRSARSFADLTSISAGIDFAMAQIERAPFAAKQRAIDTSGDGDDHNIGREVTDARDEAVAKGVTVNGVVVLGEPFLSEDGSPYSNNELESYFRDNVIGGPGAFVIVAQDFSAFGKVILNKLIAEIAGPPSINIAASHVAKNIREAR